MTSYEPHECNADGCTVVTKNRLFCSRSCSNSGMPRRKKIHQDRSCTYCSKAMYTTVERNSDGVCMPCRKSAEYLLATWGSRKSPPSKDLLVRTGLFECKCAQCGLTSWQGKSGLEAPLQVDHIDGDNRNNVIENLRLLCANCHMLTETYAGRNRNFYLLQGIETRHYKWHRREE